MITAFVALSQLRHRLALHNLTEMFFQLEVVSSHDAVWGLEAKLTLVLAGELRRRGHGEGGVRGRHWHARGTYLMVRGRWTSPYRTIDRDSNLVDTMLSEHRDAAAAQAFFRLPVRRHLLHLPSAHHFRNRSPE